VRKKGFTLIELLVAISILAVISGIGIISYRTAQQKARDSKRKADLEQVRAALEMYRSDTETYPVGNWSEAIAALSGGTEKYISTTFTDPKNYSYYYNSTDGYTYSLCAYLETGGTGDCGANCGSAPANCNYQVRNP